MLPKDRAPNWAFWRLKHFVTALEAAALSLNIEPRLFKIGMSIKDAPLLIAERREFRDRLELIKENVSVIEGGEPDPEPAPSYAKFMLSRFVDWALRAGWRVPAELRALRSENHASSISAHHVAQHGPPSDRTGCPGRPTSKHLIEQELQHRIDTGVIESTLSGEAKALARWFASSSECSSLPPPAPTTIENAIRVKYCAAKAALSPKKHPQKPR